MTSKKHTLTPEEAARRKRKQAAREKRFMRLGVFLSVAVFAAAAAFLFPRVKNRDARLFEQAHEARSSGDYEKAAEILKKLGAGQAVPEGQEPGETQKAAEELLSAVRYDSAVSLMNSGNLSGAEQVFSSLGTYLDSRTLVSECRYRAAGLLFAAGRYDEAYDAYSALQGYADSLEKQDACRFETAAALENEGRHKDAYLIFKTLGTFNGADERTSALAVKMTGVEDPALAMQLAEGYSEEEIAAIEALYTARNALPGRVLATGFYHTVGVTKDGRAVAAGRNDEGQCDVSSWTNVTAIAAGAYHTAALLNDGTVVCTGRNSENQRDTASWTDVADIACTYYGTIGLKKDGTVLYTGFHPEEGPGGWTGVTAIGGGAYEASGVRSGSLISTHPSSSDTEMSNLVAVDADTGYSLALTQDGRVLFTSGETGLTDAIAVSAGPNGYMALTKDGKVLTHYFDARNALDFSDVSGAVAISMSGTHAAILLKDGTVVSRGSDTYGECSGTASFSLKTTR